jgi:hypothetical protein
MMTYIRGTETLYAQMWAVLIMGSWEVRQLTNRHENEGRTNGTKRSRMLAVFIRPRIKDSDGYFGHDY